MMRFLWKWLYCSWAHYTYWDWRWPDEPEGERGPWEKHYGRCYPHVWIPEGEPGSDFWHCMKCHPCYEGLDILK